MYNPIVIIPGIIFQKPVLRQTATRTTAEITHQSFFHANRQEIAPKNTHRFLLKRNKLRHIVSWESKVPAIPPLPRK